MRKASYTLHTTHAHPHAQVHAYASLDMSYTYFNIILDYVQLRFVVASAKREEEKKMSL